MCIMTCIVYMYMYHSRLIHYMYSERIIVYYRYCHVIHCISMYWNGILHLEILIQLVSGIKKTGGSGDSLGFLKLSLASQPIHWRFLAAGPELQRFQPAVSPGETNWGDAHDFARGGCSSKTLPVPEPN